MGNSNYPGLGPLADRIEKQDRLHPDGYPAHRDGMRLALAAVLDELKEAEEAHRAGRCKCPTPRCDHHDWDALEDELLDIAAVAMRAQRSLQERRAARVERKRTFMENRRLG